VKDEDYMQDLEKLALEYHARAPQGKIHTGLSKPVATQADLSLAYSPGVAGPCREIAKDADLSFRYTGRGNLVGVISNGTAVLGLGNIGPYAAKPVMEGKAMLFKKFADIDVFDIEMNCLEPDALIAAIRALEPTFGGINLEDIRAPECFYIEEKLRESMNIPVFHDDQHGTAIIASAALLNALEITGKKIDQIRIAVSGAGAAAIACCDLFCKLGVKPENMLMCDSRGVIHSDRDDLNSYKRRYAARTPLRTLEQALEGADVFLGVSGANVIEAESLKLMAANPIVFALANPDPEVDPVRARQVRPDAIIATGRSDFPNQVNNALGFPFIFRGALDVRAKCINDAMKLAAVRAIADLAKDDVPDEVRRAYNHATGLAFGRDYLIPKPIDPRVLLRVAPAVAKAAIDSGVARVQLNMDDYLERVENLLGPARRMLREFRNRISARAKVVGRQPEIVVVDGHDIRALRAAAQVTEESSIQITVIGDPARIVRLGEEFGLNGLTERIKIIDSKNDSRAKDFAKAYYLERQRKGMNLSHAELLMRSPDYFGAMLIEGGAADGLVSGLSEPYRRAVKPVIEIIGAHKSQEFAGVYMITKGKKLYFFADCTMHMEPTAHQLADIAHATAMMARSYTHDTIRIAMLSYANFGSNRNKETQKVAEATALIKQRYPDLIVDGEMQVDVALDPELQQREFPFCTLQGEANVLIFPQLSAANIAYKLLNRLADVTPIGPILVGAALPTNVLQRTASVDEIVRLIYFTADQAVSSPRFKK
jgi:malate dehydrogenase (oxaloacetate-decarboxylating)(NADP+)